MQRNIFQKLEKNVARAFTTDPFIMRYNAATPGVFLHHGSAIIPSLLACPDPP